jgi:hypothetical protein
MKSIHYIHFGMPRSGSSWLFDKLVHHPEIDYLGIKEDTFLVKNGNPLDEYISNHKKYRISLNFHPMNWGLDNSQLTELPTLLTHSSVCFRNPYEFLESWYNFVGLKDRTPNFVDFYIELNFINYKKILSRLQEYVDPCVLYYDNLEKDPQEFINNVTDYLEINHIKVDPTSTNKRHRTDSLHFSAKQIIIINKLIDDFSVYVDKNMEHWKR